MEDADFNSDKEQQFQQNQQQFQQGQSQFQQNGMQTGMSGDQNAVFGTRQTDAVIGVLVVFLFNCIGLFFAFWLLAHRSVLGSLGIAFLYFIGYFVCALLCALLIGYPMMFVLWIITLVHTYKAIMNQDR